MLLLVDFVKAPGVLKALSKKAQTGIETFTVVFVLGLIFLYSFMMYVERNREVKWSEKVMNAQRECYRASALINRVRTNGYGFAEKASFGVYKVKIFGNARGVEVIFGDSVGPESNSYYCSFLTSNVTNTTDFTFEIFGNYKVVNEDANITFYRI